MSFGSRAVGAITDGLKGAFAPGLAPYGELLRQSANRRTPIEIPGVPDLIDAYQRDLIDGPTFRVAMRSHGILLTPKSKHDLGAVESRMDSAQKLWAQVLARHRPLPTPVDLYTLRNRGEIDDKLLEVYLKLMGFRNKPDRDLLFALRPQLPGPSDLVRFALREVWDDDVAETWGYDEEFRPEFDAHMRTQGYIGDARFDAATIDRLTANGVIDAQIAADLRQRQGAQMSWARAYHRASWDVPSPTMGYEMFHRLRPVRLARIEEFLNSNLRPGEPPIRLQPFDLSQMKSILKIADYPSKARDWLVGISASILTRTDIRRMLSMDAIAPAEVYEQFLDRGYVPADARLLTDFSVREVRIQKSGKVRSDTKAHVLDAYRTGVLDEDQAALRLYRLSLADPDQVQIFRRLPQAEQLEFVGGLPFSRNYPARPPLTAQPVTLHSQPLVRGELALVDADWQATLNKRAIAAARKCMLSGRTTEAQTRNSLILLNVQVPRIDQYLRLWRTEFDCGRKEVSTAMVRRLSREGILTPAQADSRLQNLGWDDDDRRVLLAEIQRDVNLSIAKAQIATARTLQQRQVALARAAVAAAREQQRLGRQLASSGTPTNLRTWYVRGVISGLDYRRRLAVLLWPNADIDRELIRAEQDRIEYERKRLERQQKQPAAPQPAGAGP